MNTSRYEVIIVPSAIREIDRTYEYISKYLYAERAAEKLMKQIEIEIKRLKYFPRINPEINKSDDLQRRYRRILVKKFVILYTIEESSKTIYISHMYYSGRNYLQDF